MDPQQIILYPLLTEKSMDQVDKENKLVFIVKRSATKKQVHEAVEKIYAVKVENVNTMISKSGTKKAFVKLEKKFKAIDIMTKMGVI